MVDDDRAAPLDQIYILGATFVMSPHIMSPFQYKIWSDFTFLTHFLESEMGEYENSHLWSAGRSQGKEETRRNKSDSKILLSKMMF